MYMGGSMNDSNDKNVKRVKEKYDESFGTLNTLFAEMLDSHNMTAGQQWMDADAKKSRAKNVAPLVYNYIKGQVDLLCGIQRQNKTALKALPEETGDNISASIASNILHHAMRKGNGYTAASQTFKDMVIGGLGWLSVYIDFRDDLVNGDLRVISDSPFDIFFDPHTKEMDLSDCTYIVKRKAVSKHIAKLLYPDKAEQIENSKSDYKSDYYVLEEGGLKNKCVIKELWEREIETFYVIFVQGQEMEMSAKKYAEMQADIDQMKMIDGYTEVKRKKQVMKYTVTINDEILAFDGDSPYEMNMFPFIPMFGFYNKSMESWKMKLSGIVNPLKDSQREINKWESNKLAYMLRSIHEGWIVDKGAVDDMRILTRGMTAPVIQRNVGKSIDRMPPVQPPVAMMEQASNNEMKFNRIGLSPDMMGNQSNVDSAKGIQLRQMQGMAKVGELTENFNYAFIQLGRIALGVIFQFYTIDKIKRILGKDYEWMTQADIIDVKDFNHDIQVDETTYNPTNKKVRLENLMQMQQYGVPDLQPEDFLELFEIDAADLKKMTERREARKQQEMAQKAQAEAVQNELIASKAQNEKAKTDNMNTQTAVMTTNMLGEMADRGVKGEHIEQAMMNDEMANNPPMAQAGMNPEGGMV